MIRDSNVRVAARNNVNFKYADQQFGSGQIWISVDPFADKKINRTTSAWLLMDV